MEFKNITDEDWKQKIFEKHWDINLHDQWFDFVYEDIKDCAKQIGIDIDKIYFSGFSSQGDGAMFEGSYRYSKGCRTAIKQHAPQDAWLHQIAEDLFQVQRKYFYTVQAQVQHRGHYYHENCTAWSIDNDEYFGGDVNENEDDVIEPLKDFMRWMYKQLEKNYDYLTSKEAITETLESNEYDFNEYGEIE